MASVAPDILRRMSSSADTSAAYGQRTPEYSRTPSAHSPATAILAANGSFAVATPTSPIFHQWKSVDELRAESAGDCRFTDTPNGVRLSDAATAVERPRPISTAGRSEQRASGRRAMPLKTLQEEAHGVGAHEVDAASEGAALGRNGRFGHQQPKPPINKCALPATVHHCSADAQVFRSVTLFLLQICRMCHFAGV